MPTTSVHVERIYYYEYAANCKATVINTSSYLDTMAPQRLEVEVISKYACEL